MNMSTKFIAAAVFLCEIFFSSANPVSSKTNVYIPGDDRANWEALWNAMKNDTRSSGTHGPGDQSSAFDEIVKINARERGSGTRKGNGSDFLFEGDIKMSKQEAINIITHHAVTSRQRRAITKNRGILWPKNIPYAIDTSLNDVQSNIRKAIAEWETTLPCMGEWRDVTNENKPRDFMYFFSGDGCYSDVGRVGGKQGISIGRGCEDHGIIIHEIGHAMGLWHEQSRPDRDNYVDILWDNIIPDLKFNFEKQSEDTVDSLGVQYDYESVMHYGAYAFSKNNLKTIETKPVAGKPIGQEEGLSELDKKQVRLLYGCETPSGCNGDVQSARNCQYWKGLGYCQKTFESYMEKNCCKTCSDTGCESDVQSARNCQYWKGLGYCEKTYVSYMEKNCCKTCNGCNSDVQSARNCQYWKGLGYCEKTYVSYMEKNCCKTCNGKGISAPGDQ
ncbi:zinc metalloproteinase nas-13-like [Dendronephthya gigantea]|uniref:zinc metalloproteinase nas-13-like n=1 Tax=Dendronephthya gigantea TaxID=151771 RepID=UPI00106987EA|nr:zinc metalloproteinase nas-13-like [Dendronephthya gigantea]